MPVPLLAGGGTGEQTMHDGEFTFLVDNTISWAAWTTGSANKNISIPI